MLHLLGRVSSTAECEDKMRALLPLVVFGVVAVAESDMPAM